METTTEKLTKEQKVKISKLACELQFHKDTFAWHKTSSGDNYWSKVIRKLDQLSTQKIKCPTCGKYE